MLKLSLSLARGEKTLTGGGRLNIDDEPLSVTAFTYTPQNSLDLETIIL